MFHLCKFNEYYMIIFRRLNLKIFNNFELSLIISGKKGIYCLKQYSAMKKKLYLNKNIYNDI